MPENPAVVHDAHASTRFDGRVAIVTGGGSRGDGVGNGRASAMLLALRGAKVLVADLEIGAARDTVQRILDAGGEAAALAADVSGAQDCEALVADALDRWGRLDVLVNNVGISGPPGNAVEVDIEAWDHAMRVDVGSMMLMAKFAIPAMRAAGRGSIINMASVAGFRGGHPSLLYPTAKGAVINLTRAMAAQHGTEGIRVNCVAPGMVHTPMVASRGMTEDMREQRRLASLLQTEGTAWDVAEAVCFLASDAARWITGVLLPVDAGASSGTDASRSVTPKSDGKRR